MRRSFASISITRNMPAAAFGLCLVPLAASVAGAESLPPSLEANANPAPVIELQEGPVADAFACRVACGEETVAKARSYVLETAHPGGTMTRQGPEVAIGRLHPAFVTRLAGAIREARAAGFEEVGVFSAYRPPAFGVGGFKDKFNSLHAYGLAVDMYGIGAPGSPEAKHWTSIAARHGVVCPYGVNNRAEWNHCQPTRIKIIQADNPLRETIAAEGPLSPNGMFDAGKALIESVANLFTAFTNPPAALQSDQQAYVHGTRRNRRIRTADAHSSRHHRNVRKGGKAVRVASHGKSRAGQHAAGNRRNAMVRRGQRASS
jgi:hypothetical protein